MSLKLLVTNRSALRRKYGNAGLAVIDHAVKALATADRARGLDTRIVDLGSASLGGDRVTDSDDPVENKRAVDAVVTDRRPDYLVILGSRDVVPYQDLKNPLNDPGNPDSDIDRFAESDLPYACETPYSQDIKTFLGPTRVVGRLPDLTGASTPDYLVAVLGRAANAVSRPPASDAFAISAKVWQRSTKKSMRNILGAAAPVLLSPKHGPRHQTAVLRSLVHFVNCHGNLDDHRFSGEGPVGTYHEALDSRWLSGVPTGAVGAFECCYGAQLYDPLGLPGMSIANRYLAKGASGVVASTTIAYGPEDDNANADVLCQLFVQQALRGASLGRAMLEARLEYARQQSVVDPYDEKTLAQFVLLGDPSIHPFSDDAGVSPKILQANAEAQAARSERRARLMKQGTRIGRSVSYTVPVDASERASSAARRQGSAATGFNHLREFRVREQDSEEVLGKAFARMPRAQRVWIETRRRENDPDGSRRSYEGLLMYEVSGRMVQRVLFSR